MAGEDGDLITAVPTAARARVRSLRLSDGVASVVLDAAGLSAGERAALEQAVRGALVGRADVADARVALVAERAGDAAPDHRAAPPLLAVGSGKGGVGKSTLAANLAVALARGGPGRAAKRVGLVDADIHGPSLPHLLGSGDARAQAHDGRLVPVAGAWGVPMLSMGHLVDPGQAVAWRGPMATGALGRLVEAHWRDAELLVVDLPPGTGDIALTMLQRHKPVGAVIVTTPQDLALIDARRAVALFEKGGVPIVGVIENMAGYACPHCGEVSDPFGHGGAEAAARELGLPFLGRVPLAPAIRAASDAGTPPAAGSGEAADAFAAIAARVAAWLDREMR